MRRGTTHQACGFTLLELVIIAGLLALTAALAIPDSRSRDDSVTENAAQQIAQAIRHARDESIRTGTWHQVAVAKDGLIELSELVATVIPLVTNDVTHPVTRQPYQFEPYSASGTQGVRYRAAFQTASGVFESVLFDPDGHPKRLDASGHDLVLSGSVTVTRGLASYRVTLSPGSGRVTVERTP